MQLNCCPQGSLFERIVPERESAREGTILIREAVQLHPFPRRAASRERSLLSLFNIMINYRNQERDSQGNENGR